jgi:Tol biopolymer transport system component
VGVDGETPPRRVTASRGEHEKIPGFSPDGEWLAFSTRRRGPWQVAAVRVDGTGARVVAGAAGDCRPDFSPDGAEVAFVSTRADGKGDIWTVPFAGGPTTDGPTTDRRPRRLTTTDALYDYHPNWSPDGRHIAFAAGPDKAHYHLFVIGADGSGRRQLTFAEFHDAHPSWAP